jgi:hypothetical protein
MTSSGKNYAMTLSVFILLFAALLHASWNAIKSGKRQAVLGDQRQRNRCDYGADLFTPALQPLPPAVAFSCLNRITGGLYRPGR